MRNLQKLLFTFICLLLCMQQNTVFSQDMELVCKIDINDTSFTNNLDRVLLNLYFKNKKFFKTVVGYEFKEVVKSGSCNLTNEKIEDMIFIAHSKDGKSQKFFYSDISSNISKIPVFIAFRERITIKDTTRMENVDKSLSKNNIQELEKLTTFLKQYKIYLQFNSIAQEDEKRIFTNFFLIFPQDQTVKRWIGNLDYIEIYKFKKI